MKHSFAPFFLLAALALPALNADAANIAGEGFGIMGVHSGIDSANGIQYGQAGQISNINDGDNATRADTWNGNQAHVNMTHSFVGVIWGPARTDYVTSLNLIMATFGDGGWFGVNATPNPPTPGAAIGAGQLVAPTVQVLGAGGWSTVAATTDYLSVMTGQPMGGQTPPITFTLAAPQTGINGIRIIGPEGGAASNGFIGVHEVRVEASPIPEPAAGLLGLGALLAGLARRRR